MLVRDGPDEKAACGPAGGGWCGEPVVNVVLLTVGQGTASCMEPVEEVHRRVGLLAAPPVVDSCSVPVSARSRRRRWRCQRR